jgi:hypothetical protein
MDELHQNPNEHKHPPVLLVCCIIAHKYQRLGVQFFSGEKSDFSVNFSCVKKRVCYVICQAKADEENLCSRCIPYLIRILHNDAEATSVRLGSGVCLFVFEKKTFSDLVSDDTFFSLEPPTSS